MQMKSIEKCPSISQAVSQLASEENFFFLRPNERKTTGLIFVCIYIYIWKYRYQLLAVFC